MDQMTVKNLFNYCSETGNLINKVSRIGVKAGSIAGTTRTDGYLQIRVNGKIYLTHRLVWLWHHGMWPKNQVDHINRVKNDNRIENLRDVLQVDNCKNLNVKNNNVSGVTGVHWCNHHGKWVAQIKVNYKHIFLGNHLNIFDAACARRSAEIKHGFL